MQMIGKRSVKNRCRRSQRSQPTARSPEISVSENSPINQSRWYDATTGRWLSEDPIGFGGGDANLYRYCGNGPTDGTDPSGLAFVLPESNVVDANTQPFQPLPPIQVPSAFLPDSQPTINPLQGLLDASKWPPEGLNALSPLQTPTPLSDTRPEGTQLEECPIPSTPVTPPNNNSPQPWGNSGYEPGGTQSFQLGLSLAAASSSPLPPQVQQIVSHIGEVPGKNQTGLRFDIGGNVSVGIAPASPLQFNDGKIIWNINQLRDTVFGIEKRF